jgi:hypothetical protein
MGSILLQLILPVLAAHDAIQSGVWQGPAGDVSLLTWQSQAPCSA